MKFAANEIVFDEPVVMGVLNMTPDSFSDGGMFNKNIEQAVERAEHMVSLGAKIIDVGGESTRPGAKPVGSQEELDRVLPIVERLVREHGFTVSVDTSNPSLMLESAKLGVGMLNDVRAFSREGCEKILKQVLIESPNIALSIMHMQGQPSDMQENPNYSDIVHEVALFLGQKLATICEIGFERSQIAVDPGFGFGKTVEHNYALLAHLNAFSDLGGALLVGMSRKSMIGAVTGREVHDRTVGGCVAAGIAVLNGAQIIRTHDVAETIDAIRVAKAVCEFSS